MLTIWTKCTTAATFFALSDVLKQYPQLPVQVVSDFSVPAGTTAILACGKDSLEFLTSQSLYPKNRTVTSLRGTLRHYGGVPVVLSYSPDIGDIDHGWLVDLITDCSIVVRLVTTGSIKPKLGKYRYVECFGDTINAIKAKALVTNGPVDVAFDMETVGTDPFLLPKGDHPGAYIVTMQVTYQPGMADLVYFHGRSEEEARLKAGFFREQVIWLLNSPLVKIRGANLKFDLVYAWVRAAIECTNFTFDTTLVGSLLDENRSNSLKVHTKIYVPALGGYDDEFDATVDKSRMDLVPKDMLRDYAGGDTDADYQVASVMKPMLVSDPALTSFYWNILHPASRAFELIERGGVCIDMDAYQHLESEVDKKIDECLIKAKKIIGGRIVAKHFDASKRGGLNLTKASMLIDFMFTPMGLNLRPKMFTDGSQEKNPKDPSKWVPSTAAEHIEMFEDVPEAAEFVKVFKEYQSASKTKSTYIGDEEKGFKCHIRSDGRFHPTYFLFVGDKEEDEGGAVTGRLSCKDPAFQTIPKHTYWGKMLRRVFCAPPGYVVTERDYSQGELKVIACIANCLSMLEIYRKGLDLHVDTAAGVNHMTYEQLAALEHTDKAQYEAKRQKGKAGNFGLVFGMMPPGFVEYARKNYKVVMSVAEATAFREGFFAKKPELLKYHEVYKDHARRYGYVRTPLGRIRHLALIKSRIRELASKAERQAINAPVQGTLTDMLIWMLALEHAEGLTKESPSFGAIHDAAYNYMPEGKVDILLPRHMAIMENLPFEKVGWKPQLKFTADAKVGPNMADLKKYKPQSALAAA